MTFSVCIFNQYNHFLAEGFGQTEIDARTAAIVSADRIIKQSKSGNWRKSHFKTYRDTTTTTINNT